MIDAKCIVGTKMYILWFILKNQFDPFSHFCNVSVIFLCLILLSLFHCLKYVQRVASFNNCNI